MRWRGVDAVAVAARSAVLHGRVVQVDDGQADEPDDGLSVLDQGQGHGVERYPSDEVGCAVDGVKDP